MSEKGYSKSLRVSGRGLFEHVAHGHRNDTYNCLSSLNRWHSRSIGGQYLDLQFCISKFALMYGHMQLTNYSNSPPLQLPSPLSPPPLPSLPVLPLPTLPSLPPSTGGWVSSNTSKGSDKYKRYKWQVTIYSYKG